MKHRLFLIVIALFCRNTYFSKNFRCPAHIKDCKVQCDFTQVIGSTSSIFYKGQDMLKISGTQWKALSTQNYNSVIDEVIKGFWRLCPENVIGKTEVELREQAEHLISQAKRWNIQLSPNFLRLLDFQLRWGSFTGDDSKWILDVLEGPLDENDKLDYLHEVLDGG